jgi:hypothetical protein
VQVRHPDVLVPNRPETRGAECRQVQANREFVGVGEFLERLFESRGLSDLKFDRRGQNQAQFLVARVALGSTTRDGGDGRCGGNGFVARRRGARRKSGRGEQTGSQQESADP